MNTPNEWQTLEKMAEKSLKGDYASETMKDRIRRYQPSSDKGRALLAIFGNMIGETRTDLVLAEMMGCLHLHLVDGGGTANCDKSNRGPTVEDALARAKHHIVIGCQEFSLPQS